jgi:hypothetical protein
VNNILARKEVSLTRFRSLEAKRRLLQLAAQSFDHSCILTVTTFLEVKPATFLISGRTNE